MTRDNHHHRRNRDRPRGPHPDYPEGHPKRARVSNGPDVRITGTAYQLVEKYTTLARDAESADDPVRAEQYLQHADHYQRVINDFEAQRQQAA
jgi:hypothetical protein